MNGYLISFVMGLAVGIVYGLVHVRPPAPPLIVLAGLLGIGLGAQIVNAVRHQVVPSALTSAQAAPKCGGGLAEPNAGRRS
jgi:XapX domain-containing protein